MIIVCWFSGSKRRSSTVQNKPSLHFLRQTTTFKAMTNKQTNKNSNFLALDCLHLCGVLTNTKFKSNETQTKTMNFKQWNIIMFVGFQALQVLNTDLPNKNTLFLDSINNFLPFCALFYCNMLYRVSFLTGPAQKSF